MTAVTWLLFFPLFPIGTNNVGVMTAQVSCQPVEWVGKPAVVKDLFSGDLKAKCTFTQAAGGGIKAAVGSLEDALAKSETIHKGPVNEVFENLDSIFYDVTRTTADSAGTLTVRSENHLASDFSTKLISVTESKSVKGTSNMAFMRKLNGRLELIETATGEYEMLVTSHTEVAKPWYAPESMFLKEVSKKGKDSFEKKVGQLANDLAGIL